MSELRDILQALDVERNRRNWFEAIQLCRFALQQVDIAAQPQLWAFLQSALGGCLLVSTEGDRAQNVEEAIAAFQEVLRFRTRWDTPIEWANTIHNLGRAYRMRLQGDPEDNLEKAIACYQEELKVITPVAHPIEWAETMYFLGNAYYLQQRGNRDENLAEDIHCYELRQQGDRIENLARAIAAFQAAVQVRFSQKDDDGWKQSMSMLAETYHELGNAYRARDDGDRAENLEKAIEAYEQALNRWPSQESVEWAATQNALGIAYDLRKRGDRKENIEHAIEAYITCCIDYV